MSFGGSTRSLSLPRFWPWGSARHIYGCTPRLYRGGDDDARCPTRRDTAEIRSGDTDLTDSGWIDSQLGVLMLQRYKIAADVARTLGTNVDPNLLYRGNFISELESRVQRFFGRSGASNVSPKVEVVTDDDVATAIGDGLDVRRVGLSYLVNVNFSSHSEALTARIQRGG